jgi:hypothetical protein
MDLLALGVWKCYAALGWMSYALYLNDLRLGEPCTDPSSVFLNLPYKAKTLKLF